MHPANKMGGDDAMPEGELEESERESGEKEGGVDGEDELDLVEGDGMRAIGWIASLEEVVSMLNGDPLYCHFRHPSLRACQLAKAFLRNPLFPISTGEQTEETRVKTRAETTEVSRAKRTNTKAQTSTPILGIAGDGRDSESQSPETRLTAMLG